MKNIFEIMKEYGLEVPEDKKTDFEKAVLENYKTVKDYEKQVEKLNEANDTIKANDTAMKDLEEKLKDFKEVDVTGLNETIENLKKDNTRIENEYKDKMAQRDTLMQSKNQKEDIAAAIKTLTEAEDSKMLFGEPDPKPDGKTNPIGKVGGGDHPKATESMADALREHYK